MWNISNTNTNTPTTCQICPCFWNPELKCHCGRLAVIHTSVTLGHPIQRFAKCMRAGNGGCNYFSWLDGDLCPKIKPHVLKLIYQKQALLREVADLQKANNGSGVVNVEVQRLNERNMKLKKLNEKLMLLVVVAFSVALGVLIGRKSL